jgi:hypothetical protein
MTPYQIGDWEDLSERASKETDPEKLRVLFQELMMYALGQEQRHVKDDIQSRLGHHFRATTDQG